MAVKFEAVEPRLLYTRAVGVDVSHYEGTINWSSVKSGGVVYAFMKAGGAEASNDNYETDATFSTNASGAAAQGIKLAPYYFPDPSNAKYTALNQADNFYSIAGSKMGNGYLPPVLDAEDNGTSPTASSLGSTALTTWVNAFCTELYNKSGVKPIVYCNSDFAQHYLLRSVSQWTLWIANYNYPSSYDTTTSVPVGTGTTYGWPANSWKFFQYTSSAPTTGDGDVFNGDVTAFNTYFASLKSTVKVVQGASPLTNSQAAAIDFGTVKQGAAGTSLSFTVSNTGSNTLTTSGLSVPTGYAVTDPLAASIVGGASDTLTLQLNSSTIGTFAGNVSFTTNDTAATTFKFGITGKVISSDTTPPTITAASYNYAAATPSVSFTFSENVAASLSLSDFVVTNDTAGATANPTGFSYDGNTNIATLSWASALANGNYTASIASTAAADAAGNALAFNYSFGFFALVGDLNRDRHTDISDLGTLATNWQATGASFAQGDITGDGKVDISDLSLLAQNWQASLTDPGTDGLTATTPAKPNAITSNASVAPRMKAKTVKATPVSNSVLR